MKKETKDALKNGAKSFAKDTLKGIIVDFTVKILLVISLIGGSIFAVNWYWNYKVETVKTAIKIKTETTKANIVDAANIAIDRVNDAKKATTAIFKDWSKDNDDKKE